jgi:FdhD protein
MSAPQAERTEGFARRPVRLAGGDGGGEWGIAVESPVEIRINSAPWSVMLATPCDVEDLAVGLALTEGVVRDAGAIERISVAEWLGEITVDLTIPADRLRNRSLDARTLAGNSGCGLCGLESLAALHRRQDATGGTAGETVAISDEAIAAAFAKLPELQPINRESHSVHAAAWCRPDGQIESVREDVGRHNALDKLVGARARHHRVGEAGFIVMSSRCSYDLVSKAHTAGASLLATISAPTTMALSWSQALGVPLACMGPGHRIVRFPHEVAHATG